MKPQATRRTSYCINVQYTGCIARGYKALYQYDALAAPATASHPEDVYMKVCQGAPFAEGKCIESNLFT